MEQNLNKALEEAKADIGEQIAKFKVMAHELQNHNRSWEEKTAKRIEALKATNPKFAVIFPLMEEQFNNIKALARTVEKTNATIIEYYNSIAEDIEKKEYTNEKIIAYKEQISSITNNLLEARNNFTNDLVTFCDTLILASKIANNSPLPEA